ncbi:biopolymer transporter ExbD [bacterium DOLJORAL78_65_58]|nr:MAG: biopolymer transporter ExbD [bacterium DOLZORAL124_64_63]PIE75951.1 MAG: biopolymer transporter ExbD [bacterium DOLJORAL78_65_58]
MKRRGHFRSKADINITSLVDVTLCLLIIFMLTAPYIQGGVEVNLPEAETRKTLVKEGPVISITGNRQVFFQENPTTMDELGGLLAPWLEDKDTVPVYLRSDEEVPYGFVLKVMAAVEREGFVNLSLVADQPGNGN